MTHILLSSVCKPIGPAVGDAKSVGYELLHGQVTRAQDIYSPRVVHRQFALDYIAENLETPATVLHYPSKRQFIRALRRGPAAVGISFVLSTAHHALRMCELVRRYAPRAKLILGGYGTVMKNEELLPHCDAICREEGVAFMRRFLGESFLPLSDYRHPEIRSRLRIFSIPVAHTGMVFAGLGCPNGCDFCCTSHFFKRKHIRLLDSGSDIFDVMKSQCDRHPGLEHTILDEDFLLNKRRARQYLERCRKEQRAFSTFAFASVKALSRFTFEELLEMGIDGVWVGYEGKGSGYDKHKGADIDQLIVDLQSHGITVLTSMIVGLPYQDEAIARKEFSQLMATKPALSQFLIYGPTPGTPLYNKVQREGKLRDDLKHRRLAYYRECTGFHAMVKHPFMAQAQIEALQSEFYDRDFAQLGPSIFRVARVKLAGWKRYKDHPNPLLRNKAERFRRKLELFLAVLPVGAFGPKISLRNRAEYLRLYSEIWRISSNKGRLNALAAPLMAGGAAVTWAGLKLSIGQHPRLRVNHYQGNEPISQPSHIPQQPQKIPEVERVA